MSGFVPLADLAQPAHGPARTPRVALVALGCAKNLVDAEQMLGALCANGYETTADAKSADVIIVNTCGFLEAAKEEALREIRAASRLKHIGRCEVLVVSGCLSQREPELIRDRCPDVDAVIGVSEFPRIVSIVDQVRADQGLRPVAVSLPDLPYQEYLPRRRATPPWTAYVKISEGCDCACTFCTIPSIRGAFRSRPIESIVAEAETLAADGVRELVLIAEDLTHYGRDWSRKRQLPALLRALGQVSGIDWIRLLYCYPTKVDHVLIEAIAEVPSVLPYLDMPLQHADPGILRAMNRGGRQEDYLTLIGKLREAMPDVCLRSTFIVGFPGERWEELARLERFLDEAQLDRVGFFPFSPEPGTPAAELPGAVPSGVAQARIARLAEQQAAISRARNERWIGRTLEVLVEEAVDGGCRGRSFRDAPEIDGAVRIDGAATPGERVAVRIEAADTHDLRGRLVESRDARAQHRGPAAQD